MCLLFHESFRQCCKRLELRRLGGGVWFLRSSTMRAAQRGRQHSTPLPLAEILILRAAQHNAIDFLFELQHHAFLSGVAAARLLSLAPSQLLTSERCGEVLVCSCCSFVAPHTSPQDKHSLSLRHVVAAALCIVWLRRVAALGRSRRRTLAQMSRRARRRSLRWLSCVSWQWWHRDWRTLQSAQRIIRADATLLHYCVRAIFPLPSSKKCASCQSAILRHVYHDQGQFWHNHTLVASHDDPLTALFILFGSLEKEVEEWRARVNTLNKSFIFGCHAANNQYGRCCGCVEDRGKRAQRVKDL